MRSLGIAATVVLLAGCASSAPVGSTPERITTIGDGVGTMEFFRDVSLVVDTVSAPPAQVWGRLVSAYTGLGVPITTVDTLGHVVGTVRTSIKKIGGHPASYVVSCGSTMTGQVIANTYSVSLTALTQLQPSGTQTIVRTNVSATAREQYGTASDPVQCGSTGALERDIAAAVRAAP